LLDPADKEFHDLAKPLFRAAIERAPELDEALLGRGKAIEAADITAGESHVREHVAV